MIAPFWDDIYTGIAGNIYYRFSSNLSLLVEVGGSISDAFNTVFAPTQLFVATWDRVAGISGFSNLVRIIIIIMSRLKVVMSLLHLAVLIFSQ